MKQVICHSCLRYCPARAPFDRVRVLCDDCLRHGVQSNTQLNAQRKASTDFLVSVGFEALPKLPIKTCQIASLHELAQLSHSSLQEAPRGLARSLSHRYKQSRTARGSRQSRVVMQKEHHITIISHLTPMECKGILAHELLHCWQNEQDLELSPQRSEGLCNLASYDFYRQQEGAWAEFLVKRLIHNPNPIYGDGFRELYGIFKRGGWQGVMNVITSRFY